MSLRDKTLQAAPSQRPGKYLGAFSIQPPILQAASPDLVFHMRLLCTNNDQNAAALFLRLATLCACLAGLYSAQATEVVSFQAGGTGWQLGTIAVGNLDSSPDLEIVVPYR